MSGSGFNFWPLGRWDPFCRTLFGGGNMAARLFDVVTTVQAAGVYALTASEDVQCDLATAGGSMSLDFPASGTEGQAIGVTVLSEAAGFVVEYTGAVDLLVPVPLSRAGDSDLFTWDADTSLWKLVASTRQGRPFNNVTTVEVLEGTTNVPVLAGDVLLLVLSSGADSDVTVDVPAAACIGQAVLVRLVVNNSAGFSALVGGNALALASDTALLVWDGSQWQTALQQSGKAARGYGLAFTDAELSGSDLAVAHSLDTQAPVVAVFDGTGALVPQGAGGYTVQVNNGVLCTLTFDAGLLPIVGTWHLNIVGFPI